MTPYDGGPTVSTQKPHNGVGPPPIPRPPPPPGVGLGSPAVPGDHSRHRQPPHHMGMPPGPHRQQSSGMSYPLTMQLPPSPNLGGPNGGPPGPPFPHHPHHPSQQRHYQQRHQQNISSASHPSQHGPQHGAPPHHPPQHSTQHHSHPSHHSHNLNHSHNSHHPPQHHVNHVSSHHNIAQQHPSHHSQHHRQHPPHGMHGTGPGPQNNNTGHAPMSPQHQKQPQHDMSHSGLSHSLSGKGGHTSGHPQQHHPSMRSKHPHSQSQHHHRNQSTNKEHKDDQSFTSSGLNGDWQSDKDIERRRAMIQQIVKLLKQRDKNASKEWLSKLPQMVKQLEVSLYRSASSFEEYSDASTLKARLQQLAMEIAKKTQQAKDQNGRKRRNGELESSGRSRNRLSSSHGQSSRHSLNLSVSASSQPHDSYRQDGYNNATQPQEHLPSRRQLEMNTRRSRSSVDNRQVNVNDINPLMGSNSSVSYHHASNVDRSSRSAAVKGNTRYSDLLSSGNDSFLRGEPPSFHTNTSLNDSKSSTNYLESSMGSNPGHSGISNGNGPSNSSSSQKYKDRQERLLLLHHSYKCEAEKGKCKVSKHCSEIKSLWKHMARCKDPHCRVSHCFSSRSILSHYKECKDGNCPTCKPVRETVRRQSASLNAQNGAMARERSVSSSRRSYGGHSSHTNDSPPLNSFGRNDHSSYHQSHVTNSNHFDRPHTSSSSSYRTDSQSPHRTSSNGGYTSKHISQDDHRRHPQSQPGRSVYRPNSSEANKIKYKQQRLLLLRHASKCPYENGNCPHTPHCASMKRLWRHIADCKDSRCKEQHCVSSRYVLTHYRDCKDPHCQTCAPVRGDIKKGSDRKRKNERVADNSFGPSNISEYDSTYINLDPSESSQMTEVISNSNKLDVCREVDDSQIVSESQQPKRRKVSNVLSTNDETIMSNRFNPPSHKPIGNPEEPPVPLKSDSSIQTPATVPEPYSEPNPKVKTRSNVLKSEIVSRKYSDAGSKNVDIPSLINCFSIEQIETHIKSLNRTHQLSPSELKKRCLEVLKGMQSHPHGWVFNNPVDPVELGLHDYFDIIKNPMDLGTIQKRIDCGHYRAVKEFADDVHLTFDNATTYNQQGSVVHNMACELRTKFNNDYNKLLTKLKEEEDQRRKNDRACSLCGCEKLLFEPPVFFCNGPNCASKRIRRNSHYYVGGSNQYYWCNQCFNELDENIKIELGDLTIKKSDLKKKKNDEVHEESWVQCDECEKWIHQICGLFNARQNKEQVSVYCCPECTIKKRKAEKSHDKVTPVVKSPMAFDLPRTKLSERLEMHVRKKVEDKCIQIARDKSIAEKCTIEDALWGMNIGGPITIRQVTSTDRKLEVRERMKKRYAHKNYPEEFSFRCKCINVFQNIDGVDVLLFALYVYEHNENNPKPNSRTVYISYLDSVHFMRPRKMRTLVYHEILICYLDYAREKGFATAHIWACPPLKGDDYIFYAKPEDQKTPRDIRLRQWYVEMLTECQKQGIVGKVTNMYDLYFKNESLDATAVPYLDGDYFAGEAENVIKDLEEGNDLKGGGGKKSKKKRGNSVKNSTTKSKSKSKSNRGGTRSGSKDQDPLISDNLTGKNSKENKRDPVMVKLGEIIQPMKASFIVAFLNWSGAKKDDRVVPKEIEEEIEKRKKEAKEKVTDDKEILPNATKMGVDVSVHHMKEILRRQLFLNANMIKDLDRRHGTGKIIDDDLEDLDCEFFNNRQSFLDLCRGNHYQFDELRRAKHTSMMILWHLHNRDAPKFVQQCAACSSEILTGFRHNCSICTDYDLCDACFKNPKTNRGPCTHVLKAIPVESKSNNEGQSSSGELEEQRRKNQRNIQLHLRLLSHAASCDSIKCTSKTCAKMKGFLKHTVECKARVTGGCKICKRLWTLLRYHAQQCKNESCRIPLCKEIRVRIRQIQKQQQAMDDRRRQEMNRACRNEIR